MTRFEGKVCVVNGAASVIGEAVAGRFAREGGTVVGVDQVEHGRGDLALRADLTDEDQVETVYARVAGAYGRVDVIYNNMGLMDRADHSALDLDLGTWRRVQDANLTSIFLACKHGVRRLLDTEPAGGAVVNAASFLADIGSATAPMAYAAAKAGVVQLTRDLGVHLARSGVRVNAVLFGPIETPAQRAVLERNPGCWSSGWCTGRWAGSAPWTRRPGRSPFWPARMPGSSRRRRCRWTAASPRPSPCPAEQPPPIP